METLMILLAMPIAFPLHTTAGVLMIYTWASLRNSE